MLTAAESRLTGEQLTGGHGTTGGGGSFHAVDPRTGLPLSPQFSAASHEDVERAASLAAEAFDTYRHATPDVRAVFLEGVADHIESLGPLLTEQVRAESGLPALRVASETAAPPAS